LEAPAGERKILAGEALRQRSRDKITIVGGNGATRVLPLGTLLGQITLGAVTITADAGNTGDGALTAATAGAMAQAGAYVLTCVVAAANAARFQVVAPNGQRLADAIEGTSYSSPHLSFDLADGATDFVVGDVITVSFAEGSGAYVAWTPGARDGSQTVAAVLTSDQEAPDGVDIAAMALVREAEIRLSGITWPDPVTDGEKAAAFAALEKRGILVVN